MDLTRVERRYADVTVTATLIDGSPATLDGVDVALTAPRRTPTVDTEWTAGSYTAGVVTVLLAGPDADPTSALVVPAAGADLWIRVADTIEVLTARIARITVT